MNTQMSTRLDGIGPGRVAWYLPTGIALLTIAACGGSGAPGSGRQANPAPGAQSAEHYAWDGYYHGEAMIGESVVELEALLLPGGQVRMRVGEASDDFGFVRPSLQFVGTYEPLENGVFGTGAVIGQGCADADAGPYCGKAVPAVIDFLEDGNFGASPEHRRLAGTLQVLTDSGTETWLVSTGWFDQAYPGGGVAHFSGHYLAMPWTDVTSTSTVLSIDSAGSMFLQSPVSGCVVNGIIADDVLVSVNIAGCAGKFEYLNGDYGGLASGFCSDPWDYACFGLSVWLSSSGSAAPATALTITALYQYTPPH